MKIAEKLRDGGEWSGKVEAINLNAGEIAAPAIQVAIAIKIIIMLTFFYSFMHSATSKELSQ